MIPTFTFIYLFVNFAIEARTFLDSGPVHQGSPSLKFEGPRQFCAS
jgi:hypothetical protein